MPQPFVLYPMLSVIENLNFVASLYGMGIFSRGRRMKTLLKFVELYDVRNRLAGKLSGGMQRRLQLAAALVHDPQLIFADEPTAGIDPMLREKFWEYFRVLRGEGHTLFITSQYVGEIRHCDIVGIMRAGRMLHINTPEELRRMAFGGEQIRFVVDPARALDAVQLLNNQPLVKDARRSLTHPGEIFVTTKDAGSALPMLIAVLQDREIGMNEADQYVPPFDDVFIELIKQKEK
jgi:ABC-2 type transport system ATP-binding protein